MAQMVERVLGKDEVTGSIPVSSSMKKAIAKSNCFFQLYSPYSECYGCAVLVGVPPSDIRFSSVRVNIISLLPQAKISRRAQLDISLGLLYVII